MNTRVTTDLNELIAEGRKFRTITASPPWPRGADVSRGIEANANPTASVAEICMLPVRELAGPGCVLFLWTPNWLLPDGLTVVREWGFQYVDTFVWHRTKAGRGTYLSVWSELLLIGVRGRPFFERKRPSCATYPQSRSGERPEPIRLMMEDLGWYPRLELFGRRAIPGWTVFGNNVELDLFSREAA
jgi:N6-adenosine-specific RNA methylase IME4